ncbi:MAG: HD domain-containing protein [Candidatus Riflebacteria bacterium]|nr:HD domain-containing protein [Candidatus Riflebacteria bacterium]
MSFDTSALCPLTSVTSSGGNVAAFPETVKAGADPATRTVFGENSSLATRSELPGVAGRNEWNIPVFDLLSALSEVTNWVSPELMHHHRQVAYMAWNIGEELGMPAQDLDDLVMAGLMHDIGAFTLKKRLETLQFEMTTGREHAEQGYLLMRGFEPFAHAAEMVRYHHLPWQNGQGAEASGKPVSLGCHLLHLADRIAVLIDRRVEVLGQVPRIRSAIESHADSLFNPELIKCFSRRSVQEALWLDMVSSSIESTLRRISPLSVLNLNIEGLLSLGNLFRCVIDFRSPFTATHSSGVAASACTLAGLMRLPDHTCRLMRVAGYLHDLGKLGVPTEILEKPDKLTLEETNVVRHHPYGSIRSLEAIVDLREITAWGALHHERINGSGYPFHLNTGKLPLEVRIMAVADVFTAVTEDRPYRAGMTSDQTRNVLEGMVRSSCLDPVIVDVLVSNFDVVDIARRVAQQSSIDEYKGFIEDISRITANHAGSR